MALIVLMTDSALAAESHRIFLFRSDAVEVAPFPETWNQVLGRVSDVIAVPSITASGDPRGPFTRGHAAGIAPTFEEAETLAAAPAQTINWIVLDCPMESLDPPDRAWEGLQTACAKGGIRLAVLLPLHVDDTLLEEVATRSDAILIRCEDAQDEAAREATVETMRAMAGRVKSTNAHCEIGCTLAATNDGQGELTSFVDDTRDFVQSYALLSSSQLEGIIPVVNAIRTATPSPGMYQTTFQPPKEPLNPVWHRRLAILSLPLAALTFAITFLLVRLKKSPQGMA